MVYIYWNVGGCKLVEDNFIEKKKKKKRRFDFEVFFISCKFVMMMVICDKGGIKGRLSVG